MSKERLERIKERVNYHDHLDDDIEFLIEQAERVQELEKDIKEWEIVNESWEEINTHLVEQNKRYREGIEKAIEDLENECLWDALVRLKALEESE